MGRTQQPAKREFLDPDMTRIMNKIDASGILPSVHERGFTLTPEILDKLTSVLGPADANYFQNKERLKINNRLRMQQKRRSASGGDSGAASAKIPQVLTPPPSVESPPSSSVLPPSDAGVDQWFDDVDWAQIEGLDSPGHGGMLVPEDAPAHALYPDNDGYPDVDVFFASEPSDGPAPIDPNALFLDIASALHDRLLQLELLD